MAGIAYPTADSRPVVFTTKALDALPKVHRLPEHLEPFVVGIDERGWVYGQAFIHAIPKLQVDPEVASIDDNVTTIRSHITELSGPTHSGPLSGVIHSAFHDVESPVVELETAVIRLVVETQDREANRETLRSLLVDELWIETRKLDAELTTMRTLVLTSSASDTPDAEVVTQVIANAQAEVVILKAHIASMTGSCASHVELH